MLTGYPERLPLPQPTLKGYPDRLPLPQPLSMQVSAVTMYNATLHCPKQIAVLLAIRLALCCSGHTMHAVFPCKCFIGVIGVTAVHNYGYSVPTSGMLCAHTSSCY